jgi:hypothetical protein
VTEIRKIVGGNRKTPGEAMNLDAMLRMGGGVEMSRGESDDHR